jgi:hypothetical protein
MMKMVLVDLNVFLLFLTWPSSGDAWSWIFPLLNAVVSKFVYRLHTNTEIGLSFILLYWQ